MGTAIAGRPRADPCERNYRTRLLPRMIGVRTGARNASHAVWRTPLNPSGRVGPALCRARARFNAVLPGPALPSTASSGSVVPLFGGFIGTMAESDSSRACMSGLWLTAFPDRSPASAGHTREVSRFSWISFPDVRGISDYAGSAASSRVSLDNSVAFPGADTVGTRYEFYEAQYPAHQCPCLRFGCHITATPARLGDKVESLLPSCGALSSPAICRFIPALLSHFVILGRTGNTDAINQNRQGRIRLPQTLPPLASPSPSDRFPGCPTYPKCSSCVICD